MEVPKLRTIQFRLERLEPSPEELEWEEIMETPDYILEENGIPEMELHNNWI